MTGRKGGLRGRILINIRRGAMSISPAVDFGHNNYDLSLFSRVKERHSGWGYVTKTLSVNRTI